MNGRNTLRTVQYATHHLLKGGKSQLITGAKGRPTKLKARWTRAQSESLHSQIKDETCGIVKENVCSQLNPHLKFVLCNICKQITIKPTKLTCDHTFGCQSLVKFGEGKYLSDLKCPICFEMFTPSESTIDLKVLELRNSLVTACKKCEQRFLLSNEKLKAVHENKCRDSKFQLIDILAVPSASEIPPEIEKVAKHVIKLKMADSVMPNKSVQLASGSSRVSKDKFIYYIIYNYIL